MKRLFFDWKVHLFCLIFLLVGEWIGNIVVPLGTIAGAPISFTIFPMLLALIFGLIAYFSKLTTKEMAAQAAPYIGIATMWLIVKLAAGIGPNLEQIFSSGPAFALQEFGNLGTALLAMPVAIFVFSMGRQSIGASFSKSREPSIAVVSSMYGIDSEEGQGVMGAYVVGTVLGTLFCAVLASVVVAMGIFNPVALAMASGSGSASMMMAFLAPLQEAYYYRADELMAYASASNLITSATGIYFSMFIVIPVCNWLYKVFKGEERRAKRLARKGIVLPTVEEAEEEAKEQVTEQVKPNYGDVWLVRGKGLALAGIFSLIGNWINTSGNENIATVTFFDALPGMVFMAVPIVLGFLLTDFLDAKTKIRIPVILWVSLIAIAMSIPGMPAAATFSAGADLVLLLPLAVPILGYAGISLGKDMKSFKEQGIGIIVITLLAFAGTYLGSAIIAHFYLAMAS